MEDRVGADQESGGVAGPTRMRRPLLGHALLACLVPVACAQEPAPPGVKGPVASEPFKPGTSSRDLRDLPKAEPYKPGDPVRVMPDLREDGQQEPGVSPPVEPKRREGGLEKE